jgi:hypothetical protein
MDRTYKITTMREALRAERKLLEAEGNIRVADCLAEFLDNASDDTCLRLYDIILIEAALGPAQA